MTIKSVRRAIGRVLPHSPLGIGVVLIVASLVMGAALFNKNRISATMRDGDTIHVRFAGGSTLVPYVSKVKISFVPVGVVMGKKRAADGTADVTLKLDKGIRAKLGSEPSAVIRPTTLLGGNYFVDLQPGGDRVTFSGTIPVARTKMPVELDKVAAALQPEALSSVQRTTVELEKAFTGGSGTALDKLAADAPDALVPAATVLQSLQGANRGTDLTNLVSGLENAARVLNAKDGQLDDIVANLTRTTGVLSDRAGELAAAMAQLPGTLRSADAGLKDLDGSLSKLRETVDPITPAVNELEALLHRANPVLADAVPIVKRLDAVLVDADPAVKSLVPASKGYTTVLKNLGSPVIDRINGPVKKLLLSPYHGSGPYLNTGSDKPVYQELAYMLATVTRASSLADRNGNVISFLPGIAPGTIGGLPISLEQMFTVITNKLNLTPRNGGK